MKVKRSSLVKIINEEVVRQAFRKLAEGPEITDAHSDKKGKEDKKGKGEKKKLEPQARAGEDTNFAAGSKKGPVEKPGGKSMTPADGSDVKPPEQDIGKDPADEELDDETGPEAEEDAEEGAKSKVSKELVGKTIQSITAQPKSKTMPGAQEVTITFDQTPDPLRILVTKSGVISYYYRGLHNEL